MSFRELIKQRPFLIGCTDPERWSAMHLMVFDHEVSDHESAFAWKSSDLEYAHKRLAVLDIPEQHKNDTAESSIKDAYIDGLLAIGVLRSRQRKHELSGEEHAQLVEAIDSTRILERSYTEAIHDVSAIMNTDMAINGFWFG